MASSDDIVSTFEHKGMTVEIVRDREPMNPRSEWDNELVTLVHWHSKYLLGDMSLPSQMTEEELRERYPTIIALLPLYLYDHSGITMNTTGFSCRWDSGQVGWGYVLKEDAEKAGCGDWSEEELLGAIVADVKVYDQFLTGDVYGYRIKDAEGEEGDSCWGFFGVEDTISAAKESIG